MVGRRHARRSIAELPVSWIAVHSGEVVGAVGLGRYDIAERQDRSPWVLGLIVRSDRRRRGIGRRLLAAMLDGARGRGCDRVWVATGDDARAFYLSCGWTLVERVVRADEDRPTNVLRIAI
jgi:GNAT superfamily N-acetyltransferase